MARGLPAQHFEKAGRGRDATARPQHGFEDHRGQVLAMGGDLGLGRRDVVVAPHDHGKRHVERRAAVAENQEAAVVGFLEGQHLAALGDRARERQRHQIGLGAGVAEPDPLQRGEARAEFGGETGLVQVGRAQDHAIVERGGHGGHDRRIGMAVEPGGILAQKIDVLGAVQALDAAAPAARHGQRTGRVVQNRAGVAAGHAGLGGLVPGDRFGIGVEVAALGLGQRGIEIEVASGVFNGRHAGPPGLRVFGYSRTIIARPRPAAKLGRAG